MIENDYKVILYGLIFFGLFSVIVLFDLIFPKRYAIKFTGLFEKGYVKYGWYTTGITINIGNDYDAKRFATKFRFKIIAKFLCKILNNNLELRDFKIVDVL